jgi:carbonic anhydrase
MRAQSPLLEEMEDNGEIMIVGAVYDVATGKVTFK